MGREGDGQRVIDKLGEGVVDERPMLDADGVWMQRR